MIIDDILDYRPTHIVQKTENSKLLLVSSHFLKNYQNFTIPVLRTTQLNYMKGYFLSCQINNTLAGINFLIKDEHHIDEINKDLLDLMLYLDLIGFSKPFFTEASVSLDDYSGNTENIVYYLLQSFITSFLFEINLNNTENSLEQLNIIARPVIERELGFGFDLKNGSPAVLKEFLYKLNLLKIKPHFIVTDNIELRKIIHNEYDFKLGTFFKSPKDTEFKYDYLYFNGNIKSEKTETLSFNESNSFINFIKCKNTFGVFVKNYLEQAEI